MVDSVRLKFASEELRKRPMAGETTRKQGGAGDARPRAWGGRG